MGDTLLLAGYALVSNFALATMTCVLGMVWFILAPFAEESWFCERFGSEYDEYMLQVARSMSFRKRKKRYIV